MRLTPREWTIAQGRCPAPHDRSPYPGSVGADKRAACPLCGKRVAITARGKYAHHKRRAGEGTEEGA